jgi:hypothetical protein
MFQFQPSKTPSFTYSGLTHHMTAAAATLKMTTPTAGDMVVICYIKTKRLYQERSINGRETTHHTRIQSSLPRIILTQPSSPTNPTRG